MRQENPVPSPSQFLAGQYTPSTMPDPGINATKYAWDTTYQCWMLSDGTKWLKADFNIFTDYTGTTDASGNFTVTFSIPKTVLPYVAPVLYPSVGLDVFYTLTSITLNGFTVNVQKRAAAVVVLGFTVLQAGSTNLSGQPIRCLVKD